jgi:hypothetical protein
MLGRWLRRLLGFEELLNRVAVLEGRRPDGDWWKEDDPVKKAEEVARRLGPRDPVVRPGPAGEVRWLYSGGPKDLDWQPELRQHNPAGYL